MYYAPVSIRYWLSYPRAATPWKYSLRQRIFGPLYSHTGVKLGLLSRMLYGWLYTDDLYYVRVDQELREMGL
jgi:hypothetical protein